MPNIAIDVFLLLLDGRNMEDFEAKLITWIQRYPFLYDVTHPKYRDTQSRTMAWTKISYDLRVSIARIKGRWRSLRNSYRIETLKVAYDKPGKWRYYEMMKFLSAHKSRKSYRYSMDSIENETKLEECNNEEDDDFVDVIVADDDEIIDLVMSDTESASSTIKLEPPSSTMSPPLVPAISLLQVTYESELRTFMEAMTEKIANENLDRDHMDELQEQMLMLLNRKLREFRKVKSEQI